MKKNNNIITFLQSFAISLVVLGHSSPNMDLLHQFKWNFLLNKIIYSFHVPLLFVISGFLFVYTYKEISLINFLNKKLQRFFIPFVSLNILAYIIKNLLFSNFIINKQSYLLKMFLYPWDGPIPYFWFLYAIFFMLLVSKLLYPFIKKHFALLHILLIITFLINIFIPINVTNDLLCINSFLHYYVYFVLGMTISKYWKTFNIVITSKFTLLFFILYAIFMILNFYNPTSFYKFFAALLGILVIFFVAERTVNCNKKFLYGMIDGYYYQIYLLHWFGLSLSRCIYKLEYFSYNSSFIIIFLTGMLLPLVISKFIENYCPKIKIFIGLK